MSEPLIRKLGSCVAKSDGRGLWSPGVKRTVRLTITAWVDPATIERDDDGTIDFVSHAFLAKFDPNEWDTAELGLMYTDPGIEESVNRYLATLGYTSKVIWSEQGAQSDTVADFDMNYDLIDELWPTWRKHGLN